MSYRTNEPPTQSADGESVWSALGHAVRNRLGLRVVVLSCALVGLFGWLLHAGALPVVPSRLDAGRLPWRAIGTYTTIWMTTLVLRCFRWGMLLPTLPRLELLRAGLIGMAAIVVLPLRTGEIVRPAMVRRYLGLWKPLAAVATERIVDGALLSVTALVALQASGTLQSGTSHGSVDTATLVTRAVYLALFAFSAALATIFLFRLRPQPINRLLAAISARVSPSLPARIKPRLEQLASGLDVLQQPRRAAAVLSASALYWFLSIWGVRELLSASGFARPSWAEAAIVNAVLGLGLVAPNAPGLFGSFQLAAYAGLAVFRPLSTVTEIAATFVFLLYVIQVGGTIAGGLAALALPRRTLGRRDARPHELGT